MKKILLLILTILLSTSSYASAPTRVYPYVPNTTIDPAQNNANENSIYSYLQAGVDTYATGSITGAAVSSSASIPYVSLSLSNSIIAGDIATGAVVLPSGAVFYMLTGSCPTNTTDVTATYSNKFIKINATQGTSSGVVLTGTTDSHTLTTPEIPAHTHDILTSTTVGGATTFVRVGVAAAQGVTQVSGSAGGGGGHTHTISSATTLEPSSITAKLCLVN